MPTPSQHAFSEKVVLVTNGDTAIGRAVAFQLALYGAFVIITIDKKNGADAHIKELKEMGTLAEAVPIDGPVRESVSTVLSAIDGLYGRLDMIVTCPPDLSKNLNPLATKVRFDQLLEEMVESAYFTIEECLSLMVDRPKPKIVNIITGNDGVDSSKDVLARTFGGALAGLTLAFAETLPAHFRVNAIRVSESGAPKASDNELDPELFRRKAGVEPDNVARTVLFLLSSEATAINGQILDIS